jgi:peptidoglycan/xylan/chitin deacetylase (PgdA/CDA1 family)
VPATIARTGSTQLSATFAASSIGLPYAPLRWQVEAGYSGGACSPTLTHKAAGCVALYPAAPALLRLRSPIPAGCVPSGAPFVSSGTTAGKEIALTFDDGPWYDTPQFLSLLEREHVVATFFQIGEQVSEYGGAGGSIERRMLADGDIIGDHTWNHQDVAGAGAFAASEIGRAAAAIKRATGGFQPCLFRAPYGDVSPALIAEARSMGFTTIQWDIDPRDWSLPGTGEIVGNVLANARPGGIVEMHDGGGNRAETLAALPTIISALRARGYTFVTVTQLLGQKLVYR